MTGVAKGRKPDGSAADLPLTAGGLLEVSATSTALPAGAATEAAQNTGNASLAAIDASLPAAVTMGNLMANPTTVPVAAFGACYNAGLVAWRRCEGSSAGYQHVVANDPPLGTTIRSAAWETTNGQNFSCSILGFQAYTRGGSTLFVVFVNKATAAATGDTVHGGLIFPVDASGRASFEWRRAELFTLGCQVALCTGVYPTITVATLTDARFTLYLA